MPEPEPVDYADEPFCYLTTLGRRTGHAHTIEIWFAVDRGIVYMMSGTGGQWDDVTRRSDWVQNLMANPEVGLRVGTHEWDARARVVARDTDEDARVRPLLRDKYATTADDLVSWARTALPVAIEELVLRDPS